MEQHHVDGVLEVVAPGGTSLSDACLVHVASAMVHNVATCLQERGACAIALFVGLQK